jgi:ABC-type branched-subunit amino acid transport system substrate-binding protein
VRTALAKHGLKMAGEATYRRGAAHSESMSRQVEILRAADPDAIICIGAYAACAAFIRDARDARWEVPIANVSFVGSENLLALLAEDRKATGRDYTRDLINSQVVPTYDRTDLPAVAAYRALMAKHNPQPPAHLAEADYQPLPYSFVSLEGFLNARFLVEVLQRMGPKLDRARLKEAAESLHNVDLGIDHPVTFSPARHQGLDTVYYTIVESNSFFQVGNLIRWTK